jgi:hypothetical protein
MSPDHARLAFLLERLLELERLQVPDHERPILDVGRACLREAIHELSHRLHDHDYCQGIHVHTSARHPATGPETP